MSIDPREQVLNICDSQQRVSALKCPLAVRSDETSEGERIYHLPFNTFYAETHLDLSRGERWFCSESEALRAGWRPAKAWAPRSNLLACSLRFLERRTKRGHMKDQSGFTTNALRSIGLAALERTGCGPTRVASERRGQLYTMSDGRTVKLRTNNDRRVIVTTDDTRSNAKLDLEGCDFVLLVVPKQIANADWLASLPKTRDQNHTWQLFLNEGKPASGANFSGKWHTYRIDALVSRLLCAEH
jgi:hypothetical protein